MEFQLNIKTDKNDQSINFTLYEGINNVVVPLNNEVIESVIATTNYEMENDEVVFMNGYQTWTYCCELSNKEKMRGLDHLPKAIINKFSLDRYADYHFVKYDNKKGCSHGFSYCYFRKGDTYRLFGSLDETPGYTIFRNNANNDTFSISRDAKGLKYSGDYNAINIFYREGKEDEVFDAYFEALNIKPITDKNLCGYSSWYNRYQDISEETISDDLKNAHKILEEGDVFQIDDGWEKNVGDWLTVDDKKFPNGLKPIIDEIHNNGYKAGLWLAPFVAEEKSDLYQKHPDWFYLVDGEPWKCGCNWSGYYALDIDNEEVKEYITSVFDKVFNEWKVDLVKLDFLYGAAPFGNEKETRAARMIRTCKWIRELCKDKLILGCGVPLWPTFGLFEYNRVSCDVSLDWDDKVHMRIIHRERPSTKHAVAISYARRHLNGRAFMNDPDVFFLRDNNLNLEYEKKMSLIKFDALFGGVFMTSDDLANLDEEKIAKYKEYRNLLEAEVISSKKEDHMVVVYTHDDEKYATVLF